MKKLPIGIQTFETLITGGYCYVDKTPLIYRMVEEGKYYFLSRPRRFGKSLFISTLKSAFSGQKHLFKDLYLENHWDWEQTYPVIHISFGGGTFDSRENMEIIIEEFLIAYSKKYDLDIECRSISGKFSELIQKLSQKYRRQVVILIDEYDKPILDNIDKTEIAMEIREGLKNFYSVIKDSGEHVHFAILTGVSKFSKVSLFSGLNNLKDITLDKRFGTICGYTETDIKRVFCDYLDGVDFSLLREWYNGYNFLGEYVYNPYDVLLYLDSREFGNYWFETASPSFLIKLLQSRCYNIPDLDKIEAGESLLSSFEIERLELETLLFQTGYLTIKAKKRLGVRTFYELAFPNLEVRMSLTDNILSGLIRHPVERERNLSAVYNALENADIESLEGIFHAFFATIPNDWYRKNQLADYEGYYASIVYCYFAALGLDVIAEDTTNKGRIDLTVRLGNKVFVIEFKVVELDKSNKNALEQIKAKRYFEKYIKDKQSIYLIGIEFSKDQRNIVSFQWEQI